ncbi:zinc ribbon domain-containing protein [Sunxiuqinia elliptica]|uniref:zinc ribbon domain-containing protein n=1 Tax=Sunxiuqinia elliptica TaxID=655355 RepID=UPI00105E6B76
MEEAYTCQNSGRKHAVVEDFRMTGAGFTRYFIIQIRKFTAVSCRKCGHPEFYKKGSVCRF